VGSLRRKTFTKPLPAGAELFTRKGETFAKWKDGNKTKTAPVTTAAGREEKVGKKRCQGRKGGEEKVSGTNGTVILKCLAALPLRRRKSAV